MTIKRYDFGAMHPQEFAEAPFVEVDDLRAIGGPVCPESLERCDRMCQMICNRQTASAPETRPECPDCGERHYGKSGPCPYSTANRVT